METTKTETMTEQSAKVYVHRVRVLAWLYLDLESPEEEPSEEQLKTLAFNEVKTLVDEYEGMDVAAFKEGSAPGSELDVRVYPEWETHEAKALKDVQLEDTFEKDEGEEQS
jgi:hypothetical protein